LILQSEIAMSRDHRRLRVFDVADGLAVDAYRTTTMLPADERFGLRIQIRRAAVSVATNIVEGAARSSQREYCRFLEVAHASARECAYLFDLSARLDVLRPDQAGPLVKAYDALAGRLLALIRSLDSPNRTA
jgi:four helix bundle protein